ncbi:MAG: hypothetical protein KAR17_14310, partial [Cyclobacteriaceae bacterium]|nr:hypothetical protein [Cyclobacteriaceae bacterium]
MKNIQFITIIIVIPAWIFATSCHGIQKKEEKQESSEQLKGVGKSEEDEEEVVFNFDKDAEGALPKGWSSAKT